MKIDMLQVFEGYDSDPIAPIGDKPFNLRYAACNSLVANPKQKPMTFEEGYRRDELAKKIFNNDRPDLLKADLELIKESIKDLYPAPLIFVPAGKMIERAIKEAEGEAEVEKALSGEEEDAS